ncbi:hypothetical protein [Helicobacter trogontum]|uniref:Uncharacterized protein n=1 Tax=Helicobacter trogontum TaxID=50960 RepID=A0A099VFY7_9HELI|nr:hypothetical protein [Helicobacter trogontum]TLD84659.1 hypothetical protein LS81_001225 [Helicobacter trogontum]
MQIFIPATIFQCKISKNELISKYRTLHITKEYVVFTNAKVMIKAYCNNIDLACDEINLDFCELKNLIKVGKKSGEISFFIDNIKENEAEITRKSSKEVIKGRVRTYKTYLDYNALYDNFDFYHKITLSKDFSKLSLFCNANKTIKFENNLITAKLGNARIAKQSESLENTQLNGLKIALSTNNNSMITLDTNKEATWYFKNESSPYRIMQYDLENTLDIIEMPIAL